MKKYLIRLDDACPTMDRDKWQRIENLLDKYEIKPMIGIIPNNEDKSQIIDSFDDFFWNMVQRWNRKNYALALHGYNHCYSTHRGGVNPLWQRSEFAGLELKDQKEKIKRGVAVFRANNINPKYFFAPSHTFDENTLIALKEESDIRIISDTIATKPYKWKGFVFIPQFSGQCREIKLNGIFTFCLHPNTMRDKDYINTEEFLKKHQKDFLSFEDLNLQNIKTKSLKDKILSWGYFSYRRLKGLK